MKNRIYTYFAIAMLLLTPKFGYADFDITTYIIEMTNNAQKSGIESTIRSSMSDISDVSKNLVDQDFSKINVDTLMNSMPGGINEMKKWVSVGDKIPAGFSDALKTPQLKTVIKKELTVGKRSGDDVKKNAELAEKANDLMIENVSLMYAKGLVRRYQLENEEKAEVEDYNNISGVQAAYLATVQRANNRWISMLQDETSLMNQTSMQQIMTIRPDETEPQETDKEQSTDDASQNTGSETPASSSSGEQTADTPVSSGSGEQPADTSKKSNFVSKVSGTVKNVTDFAGKQADNVGQFLNKNSKIVEGGKKIIGGVVGDSEITSTINKGADYFRSRKGAEVNATDQNQSN